MSRKINPEERILEYFENASLDTAQATLNMIKAIIKRKLTNSHAAMERSDNAATESVTEESNHSR
jgi:hypothetical protein